MSDEEQHRGSRGIHRTRTRWFALLVPACVLLGSVPALNALHGSPPAGATTTSGALQLVLTSYAGDAVTSTPSAVARAGSDVTYQVAVTNTTVSAQTGVTVPVTPAAPFTLHPSSVAPSQGTALVGGGALTWSVGSLAAGATATLVLTETTDAPSTTESDVATASVTSDQSATPTTVTAAVGVVPAADVAVTVSDGVDTVAPGSSLTYTITLTDNGPSAVTGATLSDSFSSDVGALGGGSSLSDASFTDLGGGQSVWTGVNLASGSSATFEVAATLPPALVPGGAIVNVATVGLAPGQVDTAAHPDALDADTVASALGGGPLGVAVSASDGVTPSAPPSGSVLAGGAITYLVTVTNQSAATQSGVSVPVTIPPAFTLRPALTTTSGTATAGSGTVQWAIPSLAAGASATLEYTETADTPSSTEAAVTQATASSTTAPPAVATSTVEVVPTAALSVGVSDGVDTSAPGDARTYTVTVTNDGPSAVVGATVSEAFIAGFTPLVDVSSLGGTGFADLGTHAFAWTGVNLSSGESATFTLMGDVAVDVPAGSAFVDVASVGLSPGQVAARAPFGATDADEVVAAAQAVTFSAPASAVAGQSVTLSGTGGRSGNPVVFSVTPASAAVCATSGVNGSTLTFVAAGTCVVDADQAGNASFAAAPTVSASIVVEQAPLFTADSPPTTGTVGQAYSYTFAASGSPAPTLALSSSAPSWLTFDPGTGSLSGTPPNGTSTFSYAVVAANDVSTVTAGPFTVTVAPTADPGLATVSASLACPDTLPTGSEGSCTLSVQNTGTAPAPSVSAAIVLPLRLRLVAAPGSSWWFGHAGAWSAGSLAPGAVRSFTVQFRASEPGRATVVGGVSWAGPDPATSVQLASSTVVVTGDPTRGDSRAWSEGSSVRPAGAHHRGRR